LVATARDEVQVLLSIPAFQILWHTGNAKSPTLPWNSGRMGHPRFYTPRCSLRSGILAA
jgi:hypothetical protein